MKQLTSVVAAVSAIFFACHCSSDGEKGGGPSSGAEPRKFGATCDAATDCDSEICFEFGNGSKLCSARCTSAEDCPSGAQGQKCNMKGYCAP
jgi:hypothetical protein